MAGDVRNTLAARELDERVQVPQIRVHAAGREKPHEMKRPVRARRRARRAEGVIREERAVLDRVRDAHQVLLLDVARAHREVADLAVPHDPVG